MTTLQEYLTQSNVPVDLGKLILTITAQAKPIRAAFIKNQNYASTTNSSGETQAEMDTWSDNCIVEALRVSKTAKSIASEERDEIVSLNKDAKYSVVMDPLDGSSLIKVNLCVGTIIGIYEGEVMQPGRNLKAAFYMLYGPMTTLTISVGNGVSIFAMDENGVYQMLKENVTLPEGNLYGCGGIRPDWLEKNTKFITQIEAEGAKNRYSGSFVADFHQILSYGGVYVYPALKKSENGKLRLLFEINPLGFLAVQAGGAVSNGTSCPLDIVPEKIHQRTPVYIGSCGMIEKIERL